MTSQPYLSLVTFESIALLPAMYDMNTGTQINQVSLAVRSSYYYDELGKVVDLSNPCTDNNEIASVDLLSGARKVLTTGDKNSVLIAKKIVQEDGKWILLYKDLKDNSKSNASNLRLELP